MNIKVNRTKLIAAIQARRDEMLKEYEAEKKKHAPLWNAHKKKVKEWIKKFEAAMETSESFEDIKQFRRYGEASLPECPSVVSKPNTQKFDKALATLAMVDDEFVNLNDNRDGDFLDLL